MLKRATFLLTGSIETTIIVSVLNVESPARWSTPRSRMLSRSVPFQVGTGEVDGRAVPTGGRESVGVGESVLIGASLGFGVLPTLVSQSGSWMHAT